MSVFEPHCEGSGRSLPSGKGTRLIILDAGSSQEGLIPGVGLIFESKTSSSDYHDEMNSEHFTEWFRDTLIPRLTPQSVVVMDNAPYHSHLDPESRAPSTGANKPDLQEKELGQWRKRLERFVETQASKTVLNTVKTHGFVVISGPPGSGKSAIAYNTAFKLEKEEAFCILPVSSPEEIRKYLSPETTQIFVIDDPVGRYAVDDTSIRRWKNEENFIKETFTNSLNTRLILTCRSYIYKSGFSRLLHVSPIHFDLLSSDLKLSSGERTKLCKRYNLPDMNEDTIMMYDFFPLLCAMFSTLEDTSMFFVNPYKILTEEIGNIKENSDIAFLAIALLVVQDNNIDKQILNLENSDIKDLLNDLCNECGFKYFPSTSVLLSALYDLIGTYVKGTENGFACIHDKLFQNISFIVGSGIIHCVLKYGSCKFLANRLQLASIQQKHDKLVIVVAQEQEKLFFERLLLDIRKGNHSHVFTGIQMTHLRYRTKLLTYLKTLKTEDLKCDKFNSTPLHVASEQGYEDLANLLVKLKKNQISHQDKNKRTPLYMACLGGHDNVVKVIHLNDKTTLEITNDDDCTPLDAASINGHSSTVALLLGYDANFKKKDNKIKRTALYRACENGHYDVVRLLLTKNPDVKDTDAKGLKAIHIACLSEHLSIVELLLGYKDIINECDATGRTPLFIACDSNQQNLVELLLQYKPDVNKANKENFTPLHKACQNKNEIIVALLLDKSAKVNTQSADGSSPLYIACTEGQLRMVETLLNKNAHVNIATKQAWTPLFFSCSADNFEMCKVLQRSGANINTADKFEFTPLHIACREKHKRIVRFLIECDANVNAVNKQKESPLYISCTNESSDIVELLLGKNADVKLCEEQGNSPLHAACQKGNKKIVQLLLDKKADKQKRNKAGKTPFDVVQGIERDKIVEMLNSATM
ncbi:CARD- and ANK-domain containing inflammasome adapter protein-like [Mytilus edulis]|uniref:CARD- and ANK-domain containing inflammasome adapter protein-like n=1 Tax=Mytilus edulis TaxID=6550 RepID=UPI0039F10768